MRAARLLAAALLAVAAPLAAQAPAATPKRIISLSPHATELLYSAGAGDKLLAVSESCDYPEVVKLLPKVSGYRGTNVEAVVALRPDVVLAWPSGNRAADLDAMRRFGISVHDSELATLASITAEQRRFAAWASDEAQQRKALTLADDADRLSAALRAKYSAARKVRVFYQLGQGRLFTLSDKHIIGEALATCGAVNVFGSMALPAPEVSSEAVLAARPDAVLVADPKSVDAVRQQWRAARLPAAADGARVVAVDGARLHRPTLRTFAAVQAMCEDIDRVRQGLR